MAQVQVVLDRVGAVYAAGEHVTGVVAIDVGSSSTSHRGIELTATGLLRVESSERSNDLFRQVQLTTDSAQALMLTTVKIAAPGKLPAGETCIPFSFPLEGENVKRRLPETYHGVYVKVEYTVSAKVNFTLSDKVSPPQTLLVYTPGQAEPSEAELTADVGKSFSLSSSAVRVSRKVQGKVPEFEISGQVAKYYNDVDIPLSGHVCIHHCNVPITSVEIQLIRSEGVALNDKTATETTEVQNIQIGDGDVPRGVVIPMHMMYPKFYTCAALLREAQKVEFEVNLVVTLDGRTQITQNIPIRLYRGRRR